MICIGFTSSSSTNQVSLPLVQTGSTRYTSAELENAGRTLTKDEDAIQIFESDDAVLLHCRSIDNSQQIFGFSDAGELVHVTRHDVDNTIRTNTCCCKHPRKDWRRKMLESPKQITSTETELTIVDLTKLQSNRRNQDFAHLRFDTAGKVFHLLRSILICPSGLHCASPWHDSSLSCSHNRAVAVLVKNPRTSVDDNIWDELEKQELNELVNFRTGDAAPSYYLHSTIELEAGCTDTNKASGKVLSLASILFHSEVQPDTTLIVFRHLPPREVLTVKEPNHTECKCSLPLPTEQYMGSMWEKYMEVQPEADANTDEADNPKQKVVMHRMISPPYLSHEQEYRDLLDSIISNISHIREEAMKIPQWTAWPERNHYSSSTDDEDNPYAAWTVFPLCHTFPANDVSQLKFIETTCSFVPQTTCILKSIGPKLRTALFSRLDKRTTLGTHTGWSDLANYVLRVHIPLIVPNGESCGTWVDGW